MTAPIPQDSQRGAAAVGERGAAAVEFAIILPILIALVGGIVDFGFAFNAQIGLAHAAREGVRVEAIDPSEDGGAIAEAAFVGLAVTNVNGTAVPENCAEASVDQAKVSISADYSFFILPFDPKTFQSEAVMRCGG